MASKGNKGGGKAAGIIIFIAVIIIAFLINGFFNKEKAYLNGYIAGEKEGIFLDKQITRLLKYKYRTEITYTVSDSIEMDMSKYRGYDFLWPSSQMVLEQFKEIQDSDQIDAQVIMNSPLVIYSWATVADALMTEGIVTEQDGVYYLDLSNLLALVITNTKWSQIGVDDLYGQISIHFTDPEKSSSGNLFMGLTAYVLNDQVPTDQTVDELIPVLSSIRSRLGFMESSTSDLFQQYLAQKLSRPLVVGYESQVIDYAYHYPKAWKAISNEVRILYPVPTIWTTHPVIVLYDSAEVLFEALMDETVQEMMWVHHGFRTALSTTSSDPDLISVQGIPQTVSKVVSLPTVEVMESLMDIPVTKTVATNQKPTNTVTTNVNTQSTRTNINTNANRDPRTSPPPRRRESMAPDTSGSGGQSEQNLDDIL